MPQPAILLFVLGVCWTNAIGRLLVLARLVYADQIAKGSATLIKYLSFVEPLVQYGITKPP